MEANDKGQVSHPISYYWNLVKDLDDATKLTDNIAGRQFERVNRQSRGYGGGRGYS